MKLVLFYEKPGCSTNAKQKKWLLGAGCMVIEQNLLKLSMAPEELRSYLEPLPVFEWFNPNAPQVKSGDIAPGSYSDSEAIALLLENPLLIRRPLVSINGERFCGFDKARIEKMIGTADNVPNENCSSSDKNHICN